MTGRSTFGPTVLAGLAGGLLAAVAGNQAWVEVSDAGRSGDAAVASALSLTVDGAPAVTALALVVLAAWGVVLVTRGRFRRAVVWLGLAAALATVAVAAVAWVAQPGDAEADLRNFDVTVARTAWAYLGVLGGLVAAAAAAVAVRGVAGWPEMGRRYDAPTGSAAVPASVAGEEPDSLGLWKALDEGHDPTDLAGDGTGEHH